METVKTINGYEIVRYPGMRGSYYVAIWQWGQNSKRYHFRTIKKATAFCETLKPKESEG